MGSWGRHSGGLSLGCCYKAWSERVSFSIFTTEMVDVLEAQQWRNRFAVETVEKPRDLSASPILQRGNIHVTIW